MDVDIEGNVSLRGSSSFTVMIDGRPSVLEPQDALESIPAASIENIEIMTNASAKYEAEGGAGIINIITKRDQRIGINGIANFNIGTNDLGGNVLLNYTGKKINVFISGDFSQRNFSGESYVNRTLFYPDTTAEFISEGTREFARGGYGVRAGLDWFISKNDILGISTRFGPRSSTGASATAYEVSYFNPLDESLYSSYDYISYENSIRGGSRYSINADYTHKFNGNDAKTAPAGGARPGKPAAVNNGSSRVHQIKLNASYSNWDMDEISETYLVNDLQDTTEGKKNEEIGPSNSIQAKLEYQLPLRESDMFEAGFDGRFNWRQEGINVYHYNAAARDFERQDLYSHLVEYQQNVISLYALYSGEYGLLGFQPAVRVEYTYRFVDNLTEDSSFVVDDLHIFPTLHLSYQLPKNIELMGSYTRRINRPRGWQLEPFTTWQDAYTIRQGNPTLKPEMSDSYDVSVQKRFGKSFVSLDAYYKRTTNKIERIQTVYSGDVIMNTFENVGLDHSLGIEAMANINYFSWWMMNLSARLYFYRVEGTLYDEPFSESSLNYSVRMRNTFVIAKNTRIQLGLNYRSRSATAQGTHSGGFMTDLALRQDLFDGQLSASINVRDIFGTGFHQNTTTAPTYVVYSEFYRDAPMFSFSLSLKINNYKDKKNGENGSDVDEFQRSDMNTGEDF